MDIFASSATVLPADTYVRMYISVHTGSVHAYVRIYHIAGKYVRIYTVYWKYFARFKVSDNFEQNGAIFFHEISYYMVYTYVHAYTYIHAHACTVVRFKVVPSVLLQPRAATTHTMKRQELTTSPTPPHTLTGTSSASGCQGSQSCLSRLTPGRGT